MAKKTYEPQTSVKMEPGEGWIGEDGSHDPAAHIEALNAYSAGAHMYKRPVPPEKGTKNRERTSYVPHPDGTARERWRKSGSLLPFPEWCAEEL